MESAPCWCNEMELCEERVEPGRGSESEALVDFLTAWANPAGAVQRRRCGTRVLLEMSAQLTSTWRHSPAHDSPSVGADPASVGGGALSPLWRKCPWVGPQGRHRDGWPRLSPRGPRYSPLRAVWISD